MQQLWARTKSPHSLFRFKRLGLKFASTPSSSHSCRFLSTSSPRTTSTYTASSLPIGLPTSSFSLSATSFSSSLHIQRRCFSSENRKISKVLITERGETACRIIKTCKALGIQTVAVHSEGEYAAEYVKMADEAYGVGSFSEVESNLSHGELLTIAKQSGAQAIHPGYGILSENASFAEACEKENIEFIGPPASAIRTMQSEDEFKSVLMAASVPCLPDNHHEADQDHENFLQQARCVEFQVFGDKNGNYIHLFEKEITEDNEKAERLGIDEALRKQMADAAVTAAKAVGCVGAGTVKFALDEAEKRFYFLEMNTRLQTDHAVTDMIGEDLVDWQFRVAEGKSLPISQADLMRRGQEGKKKDSSKDNKKKEEDENETEGKLPFDLSGFFRSPLLLFVLLSAPLIMSFSHSRGSPSSKTEITWQEFLWDYLDCDKVGHLRVVNQNVVYVYEKRSGERVMENPGHNTPDHYFGIGSIDSFEMKLDDAIEQLQIPHEDRPPVTYGGAFQASDLMRLLPMAVWVGAYAAFVWYSKRKAGKKGKGGGGGFFNFLSNKKDFEAQKDVKHRFSDVAGCEEAKQEITEFVSFLKNPAKYQEIGARIPKGALLVGPPGCGKTLLAKATAGESGVPFFSTSGSDFIEMFVGVGPQRVRSLFEKARESAPSIVFIDEIDAIGRARFSSLGGSDERDNTLNALLVEMDGFSSTDDQVVVLAGTNIPDVLDKALLRPGRFDRQIALGNPDVKSREEIFLVHMKPLTIGENQEKLAETLAELTPGFSGADIANVCNEAALIAARAEKEEINASDFEAAIERVIGGLEKKDKVMTKDQKVTVANHEAGHAVCGWYLRHCSPLLKVSIVPRGSAALGYAQYQPREQFLYSNEQIMDSMCMTLGGRVAEELTLGKISTGAVDDLKKVTNMAYSQIREWGMDPEVGNVSFPSPRGQRFYRKPYSDITAQLMDEKARALVNEAQRRTRELLQEHLEGLKKVAAHLLENEVMSHGDMEKLLGPRPFQAELDAELKHDKEERERIEKRRKANQEAAYEKMTKEATPAESTITGDSS